MELENTRGEKQSVSDFEKGYFFGVLIGDGTTMWSEKYGNYGIRLECKDREMIMLFANIAHKLYGYKLKVSPFEKKFKNKIFNYFRFEAYGKSKTHNLIKEKELIMVLAKSNQDYRRGFLRGFADAEGTVRARVHIRRKKKGKSELKKDKKRMLAIAQNDRKLLENISSLFELEGIPTSIWKVGDKGHRLVIEGKDRLIIYCEKIGFGIQRKRRVLFQSIIPRECEDCDRVSYIYDDKKVLRRLPKCCFNLDTSCTRKVSIGEKQKHLELSEDN